MQLAYFAYHFFSNVLFLFFLPLYIIYSVITGRFGQRTRQRLGLYPPSLTAGITGSPRIWLHAVSVGEVGIAVAIIEALTTTMSDCAIVLSTTTKSGQDFAREKLPANATIIYAPFDFIPSVRGALLAIRPNILVLLETEIWPNWLAECRRRGVHTALVNGRISVRSIRRYLKIRPLMQAVLAHIEVFSMISPADAQRIQSIGAARDNVITSGNAKYDCLQQQVDDDQRLKLAEKFNLTGNEPVFVAGSTRGSEQQIVLDVYEKIRRDFPETILIIAPRHIERAHEVESLAGEKGFSCQYRTDLENCLPGFKYQPLNINERQQILAQIIDASENAPSLQGNAVARSVRTYNGYREQALAVAIQRNDGVDTGSLLTRKENADLRQWLRKVGDTLTSRPNSQFERVWTRVFFDEVDF